MFSRFLFLMRDTRDLKIPPFNRTLSLENSREDPHQEELAQGAQDARLPQEALFASPSRQEAQEPQAQAQGAPQAPHPSRRLELKPASRRVIRPERAVASEGVAGDRPERAVASEGVVVDLFEKR